MATRSAPNQPPVAGLDAATLQRFTDIVGARHALTAAEDVAGYLAEPRNLFHGRTAVVLRPGSTEEVSRIMEVASATSTAIVPQGGNTGLVGGQVPDNTGAQVILSLGRLDRVREIDPLTNAMIVEAGVTLTRVQEEADTVDRLFPLSLGSEGSCQIGGNLATNAGGVAVLAYGNARALTLGLEVVLGDGRVWNGLKRLRKDNTGYDLKDLFIGSEGTLGIITAAALTLFPKPRSSATALVALPDLEAAVRLLNFTQSATTGLVTGFELLPRIGLDFVARHRPQTRDPLATRAEWNALVELSSGASDESLSEEITTILESAASEGLITDATIAGSLGQSADFWKLRHLVVETQADEGGSIKHDVSVPVARIPAFIAEATAAVIGLVPGARPVPFGHVGDGNIHFNISQPEGMAKDAFLARWNEVAETVHAIAISMGGSISAEHGIGQLKRDALAATADPVGLMVMKSLKTALDPHGILNPGKIL